MNIKNLIVEEIQNLDDYKGEHGAPTTEDSPMHDLIDTFGEDIYTHKAYDLFGRYSPYAAQSIPIIQRVKNKPNAPVKIYRAVPDINHELKTKLKPFYHIVNYYNKFNFFPMKNDIVRDLQDKYPIEKYPYEKQQELILKDVEQQIENLKTKLQKPLTINNGDWVTINLNYAKQHGKDHLNNKYKILSKTVRAKNLFTDGNDVSEWGYVEIN